MFNIVSSSGITSFAGVLAGVSVSESGQLSYVYNNGKFESSISEFLIAGISYNMRKAELNGVVETSGYTIAKNINKVTAIDVYAGVNSDGISMTALSEKTISCGSYGGTLKIVYDDKLQGYLASIS